MIEEVIRFVSTHRACGELRGDVEIPRPDGYLVWVACVCGEVFQYWVTLPEVARDLGPCNVLSPPN